MRFKRGARKVGRGLMERVAQYGSSLHRDYTALESFKQVGEVYGEVLHFGRIETRRDLTHRDSSL